MLDPVPHVASKDWARAYEAIEMNLIHSPGSGSEDQARALSDKYPEILSYASTTFADRALAEGADKAGNVTWQRRRVSAFCVIAPPEACGQAMRNIEVSERGIRPRFIVAQRPPLPQRHAVRRAAAGE